MKLKHVIFHSPGPSWLSGVSFQEQPNVMAHAKYYAKLHEEGKLLYGGPFIDQDSGGMMIAQDGVTREELEKFAAADPAVTSGLLTFVVKSWYIAMSYDK